MFKSYKLYLFLGVIGLIISLYQAGKVIVRLSDKVSSLETNVLQMDSTNKQIALEDKMFKRVLASKLDTIEKKTGVPSNTINKVTYVTQNYHSSDTTIYVANELDSSLFDISYPNDGCWGYKGTFDVKTKEVLLSEKWAKSEITIFGKRKESNGDQIGLCQNERFLAAIVIVTALKLLSLNIN
jgi:hypothetical protein